MSLPPEKEKRDDKDRDNQSDDGKGKRPAEKRMDKGGRE